MNELLAKLRAKLAATRAAQYAALAAAEADGVAAADKATHLAEFDRLDAQGVDEGKAVKRAEALAAAQAEAARPAVTPLVFPPHDATGGGAAGPVVVPAAARRHGPLRAFKGPQARENAYAAGVWAAASLYHVPAMQDKAVAMGLIPQATITTLNNGRAAIFVPDVISTAIIELYEAYGAFRRLANVETMTSDTKTVARWNRGVKVYWVAEADPIPDSDLGFDGVKLVAKKLAALCRMSREFDEDSVVDLGEKITMAAALAFAEEEDRVGFFGQALSSDGGITGLFTRLADPLNAASLVTAAAGHTTFASLTLSDYARVVGALPSYAGIDPKWLMHKEGWAASGLLLSLAAGGATVADFGRGPQPVFLGYPVEFLSAGRRVAQSVAGSVPVAFGDLKLSSTMGDRRRQDMRVGEATGDFERELMSVKMTERIDIVNHTITDPRDITRPGPVVGLQLAAA